MIGWSNQCRRCRRRRCLSKAARAVGRVTEGEWAEFVVRGEPAVRSVARVDETIRQHLAARTTVVRIRHDYVLKIIHKHGIEAARLPIMGQAIRHGRAVADRMHHVSFFHDAAPGQGEWYQTTVKSANHGMELWVCTFHRQTSKEVVRHSKGIILRPER